MKLFILISFDNSFVDLISVSKRNFIFLFIGEFPAPEFLSLCNKHKLPRQLTYSSTSFFVKFHLVGFCGKICSKLTLSKSILVSPVVKSSLNSSKIYFEL